MSEVGSVESTSRRQFLAGALSGCAVMAVSGTLGALTHSGREARLAQSGFRAARTDSLTASDRVPEPARYTRRLTRALEPTDPPVTTTTTIPQPQPLPPLGVVDLPDYIRRGPADRAQVAITIDDFFGPMEAMSLAGLLDIALDKQVRFSFFPTGGGLETHRQLGCQELWQRAVAEGHEIGNHTYTHGALTKMNSNAVRDELVRTQDKLHEVLGFEYPMRLMRPPGGAGGEREGGNPRIMEIVKELGMSMVMWTADSNNTAGNGSLTQKIMGTSPEAASNGSIILTHFATYNLENFPDVIDRLRAERSLEPTSVSGLFVA